jgi:hypothetical protein
MREIFENPDEHDAPDTREYTWETSARKCAERLEEIAEDVG